LILFIGHTYNEKALGFNLIVPLIIFSIFYIIYSLLEKKK
jgi:hypothetical protein